MLRFSLGCHLPARSAAQGLACLSVHAGARSRLVRAAATNGEQRCATSDPPRLMSQPTTAEQHPAKRSKHMSRHTIEGTFQVNGLHVTDHVFRVPLDHSGEGGERPGGRAGGGGAPSAGGALQPLFGTSGGGPACREPHSESRALTPPACRPHARRTRGVLPRGVPPEQEGRAWRHALSALPAG